MVWTDVPCWYTIRTDRFRTSSYATVTMSTAPPFSSRVPMVQTIDSIWSMSSLGSYGGQSDDEDAPDEIGSLSASAEALRLTAAAPPRNQNIGPDYE